MSDPRTTWRQRDTAPAKDIRVAIAGTFTCEPIEPYVGTHLLERGFKAPDIVIAPFGQIRQICNDHEAVLGNGLDAIVILWRIEDLFPDALAKTLSDRGAISPLLDEVRAFTLSLKKLRESFGGILAVSMPPYPQFPGFDVQDIAHNNVWQTASAIFADAITGIENLRVLPLDTLLLKHGIAGGTDARKWYLYRQPYTEKLWQDIGVQAGRIVAAERLSPKKCIVLDCDNTLWGGIVGEDGLGGIALGDEFPGLAFRDFQKQLMHLKSRGTLLAVSSKNNPEDVYEVFDKHDAMVLSRKDIAVFEVHWQSKVDSIRRIAEKLNIGTDALVFIDDNPKEIGEVQERLPEVTCLLCPEEPADIPGLLQGIWLFDKHDITDEDLNRTEMMQAETTRKDLQETMSEDDFRKSLGLAIDIFAAETQHIARVTQLINKTNQFNLTTRRRTQPEVEALAKDINARVLGMTIRDKYGDYGLVGAAILKKSGDVCDIDTLLMSCRVLGRGAETTLIAGIAKAAQSLGCTGLRGEYIPTAKNAMVKDLYAKHGFTASGGKWTLDTANAPSVPEHIKFTMTA